MHEMSLITDLMNRIIQTAREQNAVKVTGLKLKLGALSHFSPEHFQEHFDQASAGTLAEGAKLDMELSENISDPNAQSVILEHIELEK